MAEEKNYIFPLIAIVAIVAIVGIVVMILNAQPKLGTDVSASASTEQESLLGAATTTTCNDTDRGRNYLVKGTCKDTKGSYVDRCSSPTAAEDWYCAGGSTGNCALTGISCTYYYGSNYICQNGACVKKTTCTDSDGGMKYLVKGTCKDTKGNHTDGCSSSNVAEDWYCAGGSTGNCAYTAASCSYLYGSNYSICRNGACVKY